MDIETINKYIGHRIFITLRNGFRYKFFLDKNNIINEKQLSFSGKFNEPVDISLEDITFITYSEEVSQ